MSARPLFWPASRVAARRRVSRRGFFIVAGVHLAALVGVTLLSAGPAKLSAAAGRKTAAPGGEAPVGVAEEPPPVVWMDPAAFEAPPVPAPPEPAVSVSPPEPAPEPRPRPLREPFFAPTPRRVTPHPKPAANAVVPPRKSPVPPKVRPPNPAPKPANSRPRPPAVVATNPDGGDPASGRGGGTDTSANPTDDGPAGAGGTDWYASMLHERFHARWEQPTSVFATTQRYVATLRLRIERDGRISDYRLVRSSGLVPMDESVQAAAARVARVDPPPSGLLRGGVYVVNVSFVRE